MKALIALALLTIPGLAHADPVDCFLAAYKQQPITDVSQAIQLCQGASDTKPVDCLLKAYKLQPITDINQAILLCKPIH